MKSAIRRIVFVIALALPIVVLAQEPESTKVTEAPVAPLAKPAPDDPRIVSLLKRMEAVEQKSAPSAKERAKTLRKGYRSLCESKGLKLSDVQFDTNQAVTSYSCKA